MDLGASSLHLAACYDSPTTDNIPSCAFSVCGNYFAFVESPFTAVIYPFKPLRDSCFTELPPKPVPQAQVNGNGAHSSWQITGAEPLEDESAPLDLKPIYRIHCGSTIQCINFAAGESSRCRLPERLSKRVSRVVQGSELSLIILGLANGVTEVYNLSDIVSGYFPILSLMLFADKSPIFSVPVARDGSLRLASVHLNGDVKLWDLWDEGNMYANLKPHLSRRDRCGYKYQIEACTFAWQPYGYHVCAAGQSGCGAIFESEIPFNLICLLGPGHYHRICGSSYTHDGSLLITLSYDSSCMVWSVPDYKPLHRYWHMGYDPGLLLVGGSNGHHLYGLAVAPDDLSIATICEDRRVRLWPLLPTSSPAKTYSESALPPDESKLRSVAFSKCGRAIMVSTSDNRLLLFTTPSHILSLTVQCLHVLRRCIVCHLQQESYRDAHASEGSTLFHDAASSLPLPPKLLSLVLRDFPPGGLTNH